MVECPDKWCMIRIHEDDYRIFGSWYGSYLGSDSWSLNSGVVSVESDENFYKFTGTSGTVYKCTTNLRHYGATSFGGGQLSWFLNKKKTRLLPKDTNFMLLDYSRIDKNRILENNKYIVNLRGDDLIKDHPLGLAEKYRWFMKYLEEYKSLERRRKFIHWVKSHYEITFQSPPDTTEHTVSEEDGQNALVTYYRGGDIVNFEFIRSVHGK